jgi:hypothetical protein
MLKPILCVLACLLVLISATPIASEAQGRVGLALAWY